MALTTHTKRKGASSVLRTLNTLLLLLVASSSLSLLPLFTHAGSTPQLVETASQDALFLPGMEWQHIQLSRRADSGETQAQIANLSQSNPFQAASDADNQLYIKGNYTGSNSSPYSLTPGTGDDEQLQWNSNVYFQEGAATNGSQDGGWQALPQTPGFILNRTLSIPNDDNTGSGIMPFYITENVNTPQTVKRAIIVWPSKPRDVWNYANLMMNARSVVATNFASWGVTNDSVLILGPMFMAMQDMTAGAGHPGEFAFGGELWQRGSYSRLPLLDNPVSSYEIMDFFVNMLMDQKEFPNLNQVVVAGHSLGGQAAQRYALLRKSSRYDYNVRYWVGNPGAWAWLTDNFPDSNSSCPISDTSDSPTTWPFGLGGNLSALPYYARDDVKADRGFVIKRFLERKVAYAFGLLDNGPGSTACGAQWQGANHLDRGASFIMDFQNNNYSNYNFPENHTVDFLANISHQDYPMYSSNISLQRLFYEDFNTRYPDTAGDYNPSTTIVGRKPFATPMHEKVAIALLTGSVLIVAMAYVTLLYAFKDNYDPAWEKMPVPARRKLNTGVNAWR